ncbi:hypothetical protein F511_33257 [Dorcoceras hygrometricum]|uniref:Uncharacterized protein n=1 Tax=Dorcoceras hygrometricum TaxID=472368 RepID=A0A2Z7D1X9_9LAMI|nr:hypothetical protein F511_33257 [Dorcoceras hygrometricum]
MYNINLFETYCACVLTVCVRVESQQLTSSSRKSSTTSLRIHVYYCFALLLNSLSTGYAKHCSLRLDENCLRLDFQLVVTICLQLVVQSLVSNACDWTSHDWVDQTMSYQLIQMTSFAKHPRLVEYKAEALVWICCSFLLVSCDCWISTQRASAESLARRQNAVVSTYVNDIVLLSLSPSTNCW